MKTAPLPSDNRTTAPNSHADNLALVQLAAEGDPAARQHINTIAHPMIAFQSCRFCKQFCSDNKYQYSCSLPKPWGNAPAGAAMCEWGNASYGWMLDDLTSPARLRKFEGKNNARINDYLYRIANSLPFYERWKEWRFGKRLHVPTYIQALHEDASTVFIGLYKQDTAVNIALKNDLKETHVENLVDQIIITLTQRNRLHLLNPPKTVSLSHPRLFDHDESEDDQPVQSDVASHDASPETTEDEEKVKQAWQKLEPAEQFVLEAMLLDEDDASAVLTALAKLDIRISEGVLPDQTTKQQLYYFRRKTLARLAELSGFDNHQGRNL